MGPTALEDLGFISSDWDLGVNETVNAVAHETGGVPIFTLVPSSIAYAPVVITVSAGVSPASTWTDSGVWIPR